MRFVFALRMEPHAGPGGGETVNGWEELAHAPAMSLALAEHAHEPAGVAVKLGDVQRSPALVPLMLLITIPLAGSVTVNLTALMSDGPFASVTFAMQEVELPR